MWLKKRSVYGVEREYRDAQRKDLHGRAGGPLGAHDCGRAERDDWLKGVRLSNSVTTLVCD